MVFERIHYNLELLVDGFEVLLNKGVLKSLFEKGLVENDYKLVEALVFATAKYMDNIGASEIPPELYSLVWDINKVWHGVKSDSAIRTFAKALASLFEKAWRDGSINLVSLNNAIDVFFTYERKNESVVIISSRVALGDTLFKSMLEEVAKKNIEFIKWFLEKMIVDDEIITRPFIDFFKEFIIEDPLQEEDLLARVLNHDPSLAKRIAVSLLSKGWHSGNHYVLLHLILHPESRFNELFRKLGLEEDYLELYRMYDKMYDEGYEAIFRTFKSLVQRRYGKISKEIRIKNFKWNEQVVWSELRNFTLHLESGGSEIEVLYWFHSEYVRINDILSFLDSTISSILELVENLGKLCKEYGLEFYNITIREVVKQKEKRYVVKIDANARALARLGRSFVFRTDKLNLGREELEEMLAPDIAVGKIPKNIIVDILMRHADKIVLESAEKGHVIKYIRFFEPHREFAVLQSFFDMYNRNMIGLTPDYSGIVVNFPLKDLLLILGIDFEKEKIKILKEKLLRNSHSSQPTYDYFVI